MIVFEMAYQGKAAASAVANFASSDAFAPNILIWCRGTATAVAFFTATASAEAAAIISFAAAAALALPAVLALRFSGCRAFPLLAGCLRRLVAAVERFFVAVQLQHLQFPD